MATDPMGERVQRGISAIADICANRPRWVIKAQPSALLPRQRDRGGPQLMPENEDARPRDRTASAAGDKACCHSHEGASSGESKHVSVESGVQL